MIVVITITIIIITIIKESPWAGLRLIAFWGCIPGRGSHQAMAKAVPDDCPRQIGKWIISYTFRHEYNYYYCKCKNMVGKYHCPCIYACVVFNHMHTRARTPPSHGQNYTWIIEQNMFETFWIVIYYTLLNAV